MKIDPCRLTRTSGLTCVLEVPRAAAPTGRAGGASNAKLSACHFDAEGGEVVRGGGRHAALDVESQCAFFDSGEGRMDSASHFAALALFA